MDVTTHYSVPIFDFGGYRDWSINKIKAPDYRDNDIFYTICDNKITAVKISGSYLHLSDSSAIVCGTFKTPMGDTKLDKGGYLRINTYKEVYTEFYSEDNHISYPIYDTIEDAKSGIKSTKFVLISDRNIANKGYEFGKLESCGCQYYVEVYYWTYYTESLKTVRSSKRVKDFVWNDNNELLLSDKNTPIPNRKWITESDVLTYLADKAKSMEVISFPEEEKPEEVSDKKVTLTIEVTANMSLNDIAMLIAKQMDGKEE